MTYSEATQLAQNNQHLIGKTYRGGRIDDVVVVPNGEVYFQHFLKTYLLYDYNGLVAIQPFTEHDVSVLAFVNRKYIEQGIFFYAGLAGLEDELTVNW